MITETPAEWTVRPLGELARVYSGGTPLRSVASYWNGSIPWVTTTEIDFGIIKSANQSITDAGLKASAAKIATPGTVLIAMYGQGKTRGKSALLGIPAAMNQACAAVEVHPGLSSSYLLQYLASQYDAIRALSNSGGQENLSGEIVKKIPIVMPSPAEQEAIVEVLQDADSLISVLNRLIVKKVAIRQGVMQQLLSGKSRLPGFRAEWRMVTLAQFAQFSMGNGLPKSDISANGAVACIHYGELFTQYGPEIRHVTSRTDHFDLPVRSQSMDVLMPTADVTPRGLAKASALFESGVVLGGGILMIRPDKSQIYGPFLANAIRQDADQVLSLVRGSTVFHLYAADMRNFSLRVPSVEEQKAICSVIGDVQTDLDVINDRLTKARAIRRGMMQELLTGRIRLHLAETMA